MARPKRQVVATAEETLTPPQALTSTQSIARVFKAEGNNLYSCTLPDETSILVELPPKFRSTIWIKRGGFVLVDTKDSDARQNKLSGEITNVVRDERAWRKQQYWPEIFAKSSIHVEDSDEEESVVGKMPPDDEDED